MLSICRRMVIGGVALVALAAPLRAQCPDGTPPPCNRARPATPPRAAIAMDDRTWIVLPFENLARAVELEWLKDASVNLLYMDLSRWSDVHAVDDKRVADYLRDAPGGRTRGRLSLNDGLSIAKRAGAGRLVMGEFLKVGSRTAITATAYNTRTGASIRTVRQETAVVDSLLPLFGQVARGLLAVPPPAGSHVGAVGTTRADAYQEYLAGVTALNRFDVAEAKKHLELALQLDTAFALAHYKLAIAGLYDEAAANARMAAKTDLSDPATFLISPTDSARTAHAMAAVRLGESLPSRERALINGLLAHIKQDYAKACEWYGNLVRADSSDVEALFGVGRCTFSDDAVEFVGGDSTRLRFRGSWNTTLRVLRRALAIDPSFHLAFDHILDVLNASSRIGCHRDNAELPCARLARRYLGNIRRDGDSMLVVPKQMMLNDIIMAQVSDARRSASRRQNLEEARAAAEDWVMAGPREGRAHRTLGTILLRQGRLEEADREVTEAAKLLPYDEFSELPFTRIEIALKRGRISEALRINDSMGGSRQPEMIRLGAGLMMGPMTGHVARAESVLAVSMKPQAGPLPPAIKAYFGQSSRIVLGVGGDSTAALEKQLIVMFRAQKTCNVTCLTLMSPSWVFGLRVPRSEWPGFDSTAAKDRRMAPAIALAAKDTTGLRAAARLVVSATAEDARLGIPEDGTSIAAADAFLILGDSASALRVMRRMTDTTLVLAPLQSPVGSIGVVFMGTVWPRAMLLRADLESAKGSKEEAKRWYRRFVELWVASDPEFAPLVERARRALAP